MEFSQVEQSFYEKCLQTHLKNEEIQVVQVKKTQPMSKGDNYFSDIYRIFLTYKKNKQKSDNEGMETISLIVKVKITSFTKETIHTIFLKELKLLQQVLPRLEQIIGCSMGPKLLHGNKNTNFFVMEDLALKGYSMQNRLKGLSLAHCLVAIEKLAKFHAGTVVLIEEEPELPMYFDQGLVRREYPDNYFQFLESSLLKLSAAVANWNDEEYNQAIQKIRTNVVKTMKERLLKLYEKGVDEFCVLNHGDFWTNNILFKYNESGEPCDCLMVDYQCPVYTSPAIDLQYFLCTSPESEIMCDKDNFLLERYLLVLKSELKRIGCKTKPPTIDGLKKSIYRRRIYSVFSGLIYLPRMTCVKSDVEAFDQVIVSGESKLDFFKNPNTKRSLQKLLKAQDERGYLD